MLFPGKRFRPNANAKRKKSPTAYSISRDTSRTNQYRRKKCPTIGELLDLSTLSDCYVYDPFLDRQIAMEI